MERNQNSKYYYYFKERMKPHPVYEGVRWAVKNTEYTTIVVYEKSIGHINRREKAGCTVDPKILHDDGKEKFTVFLGYSEDTPDEVKKNGYKELCSIAGEKGIFGSGFLTWSPPGDSTFSDISKEEEEKFREENPVPEGTVVYMADIYTPVRPEMLRSYENS